MFLCPSSPPPGWNQVASAPLNNTVAPGCNYFASLGSTLEYAANQMIGPPNGPFQYNGRALGIRDIIDGTSNTVAFGEWRTGDGNSAIISVPADIVLLGSLPPGVMRNTPQMSMPAGNQPPNYPFQQWLNQCAAGLKTDRATTHTSNLGESWSIGTMSFCIGNILLAPNPRYPNCSVTSVAVNGIQTNGMFTLSSYHPGGANVLMCDGSVKFLKDSTNLNTIWRSARSTRARSSPPTPINRPDAFRRCPCACDLPPRPPKETHDACG